MTDPLDTEAEILAAMAWCLDRSRELDSTGQPLSMDDQRRLLSIARRTVLHMPARELPREADARELPAWLLRLAPDPQQES